MGELLGISGKYVGMIERGEKDVDFESSLGKLFSLIENSPIYSGQLSEEMTPYGDESFTFPKALTPPKGTRMIPVIGWAHAGDAKEYEEQYCEEADYVPTLCRDDKAFGLTLEGDSMMPRYHEGAELIISPSEQAYSGQYVVVKFTRHSDVLFRRLERTGDTITLIPENEKYAVKEYATTDFEWIYPVYGVFERLMK